jgi:hypothetical protein
MFTVTASLSQAFESQLSLRNIPDQQRRDFHKWLRFYLDFCNKYTLDPKHTASFAGFDEKLKSKGQSDAPKKTGSPVYCHLLPNNRHYSIAAGTVRQFNR